MKKIYYLLTILCLLTVSVRAGAQCAGGATPCNIIVDMYDSYGDGWNSAQLLVYQGTEFRGFAELESGFSGSASVPVCSDSIVFIWSAGWYDSECSFVVTDESGDTLLAARAMGHTTGDTMGVVAHQCSTCPRVSGLRLADRTHNPRRASRPAAAPR